MSISSKLISIAKKNAAIDAGINSAKTTIANNLQTVCRVPASDTETLTDLAEKVGQADPDEWRPDPLWPSLDDIADGEIGFIVADRDITGAAGRFAFAITTSSGNYTIDWGDGVTESLASGGTADHTYSIGGGTPSSDGQTTYKALIRAAGTIMSFAVKIIINNKNVRSAILFCNYRASGTTVLYKAFQFCVQLQSVKFSALNVCNNMALGFQFCVSLVDIKLPALPACTTVQGIFSYCSKLGAILIPDLPLCTTIALMFQLCGTLRIVSFSYLPVCSNFSSAFQYCGNLESVIFPSLPECTTMAYIFYYCSKLSSITIPPQLGISSSAIDMQYFIFNSPSTILANFPSAKLVKLSATSDNPGLRVDINSLSFSPQSTFSGTAPQIDISRCNMTRAALIDVFNQLPTLSGKQIKITGCTGVADLTAADLQIATSKGWTVITA